MTLQLENILTQIVRFLKNELNLKQEHSLAIISPLKTEHQAQLMMYYLNQNKNNQYLMKIDNLLKITLKISEN